MNIIDQIDKNTNITVKIKGNELIIKVPLQTTCNNTKPTISNISNNFDNESKTTTHSQINDITSIDYDGTTASVNMIETVIKNYHKDRYIKEQERLRIVGAYDENRNKLIIDSTD